MLFRFLVEDWAEDVELVVGLDELRVQVTKLSSSCSSRQYSKTSSFGNLVWKERSFLFVIQSLVLTSCFHQAYYNSYWTTAFVCGWWRKTSNSFLFFAKTNVKIKQKEKYFLVSWWDNNFILTMALGALYLITIVSCCK